MRCISESKVVASSVKGQGLKGEGCLAYLHALPRLGSGEDLLVETARNGRLGRVYVKGNGILLNMPIKTALDKQLIFLHCQSTALHSRLW